MRVTDEMVEAAWGAYVDGPATDDHADMRAALAAALAVAPSGYDHEKIAQALWGSNIEVTEDEASELADAVIAALPPSPVSVRESEYELRERIGTAIVNARRAYHGIPAMTVEDFQTEGTRRASLDDADAVIAELGLGDPFSAICNCDGPAHNAGCEDAPPVRESDEAAGELTMDLADDVTVEFLTPTIDDCLFTIGLSREDLADAEVEVRSRANRLTDPARKAKYEALAERLGNAANQESLPSPSAGVGEREAVCPRCGNDGTDDYETRKWTMCDECCAPVHDEPGEREAGNVPCGVAGCCPPDTEDHLASDAEADLLVARHHLAAMVKCADGMGFNVSVVDAARDYLENAVPVPVHDEPGTGEQNDA